LQNSAPALKLVHLAGKRCLDVTGGSLEEDGSVELWSCIAYAKNQDWEFTMGSVDSAVRANLSSLSILCIQCGS